MERRLSKRITIGFKAELISGSSKYTGEVENLSEEGACVIIFPSKIPVDFMPGSSIDVNFKSFSGEEINLTCTVKWSNRTLSHELRTRLGLEITNPPWKESSDFI